MDGFWYFANNCGGCESNSAFGLGLFDVCCGKKLIFSIENVESVAINANIKLVFYFPIFDQFLSRRLGDL